MLFSDESPSNSSWFVRGTSVDQMENVLMRNAPYQQRNKPFNQMIWGTMSRNGVAALSFLPPGTTMNEPKYVRMLSKKLKLHLHVHNCQIFMQDGTPCHSSKVAENCWIATTSTSSRGRKQSGLKSHRQFVDQHEKSSVGKATIKWRRVGKSDKGSLSEKIFKEYCQSLIKKYSKKNDS